MSFPAGTVAKNLSANAGDPELRDRSLSQTDPLEGKTATHCSVLAWKTVLGLCCDVGSSLVAASGGYSLVVKKGLLFAVDSLVAPRRLWGLGLQ